MLQILPLHHMLLHNGQLHYRIFGIGVNVWLSAFCFQFFFYLFHLFVDTVVARTISEWLLLLFYLSFFFSSSLLLLSCFIFFFILIDIAIVSSISDIDMATILLPLHSNIFMAFITVLSVSSCLIEQSMMTKMRQFRSLCTRYCSCLCLAFFAM